MTTLYRVSLRFTEEDSAPKVTGEWASEEIARRIFRSWIGLYGGGTATIRVEAEQDDGSTAVLDAWPTTT